MTPAHFALVLGLSASADSAVLFDNFGSAATGFNRTEYQNDASTMAFMTGTSPVTLNSVTIELFSTSSEARDLRLEIFSNNPTTSQPAVTVGEFDQLIQVPAGSPNGNVGSAGPFTTTDAGILLPANTIFWLVVSGAGNYGNGNGGVFWTLHNGSGYQETSNGVATVPGYSSYTSNDGGITWPNAHDWHHIVSFGGTPIPEPSLFALGFVGIMSMLWRRSR